MPNIPSRAWFPGNLQDRAAWFDNFATQFAVVHLSLGFVAADSTSVQDDNTCFQDIASGQVELEAFSSAVREYRKSVSEGDIGDPTPAFPAAPAITPGELRPAGIFQRLIELRDRILAAPAFTEETGALLGINTTPSGPTPEVELKPELKASAKLGNVIEVKFTRGKTDGIEIEMKLDNDVSWTNAGRFMKSPITINVPHGTGLPRSVQLRGHYLIDDTPVGENSDIVTVVTTP